MGELGCSGKKRFYSMLIEWDCGVSDSGEYGWTGWASDEAEAELLARKEMMEIYYGLDERHEHDESAGDFGGAVLDTCEGAQMWMAPMVAARLEELHREGAGATCDEVANLLHLLRPSRHEDSAQPAMI